MSWVRWHDELFPSLMFGELIHSPGICSWCGGLGVVPEQIDEERFPVAVPCGHCQMHCDHCRKWVTREHHQCGTGPP